ncbi:hypothetical protein K438DRAFT_1864165 [Mycena galopus ATCC 62051]|nr:hypothetical protein K438DRAFT_1864165 [Mycena galopus ATCC 62051]
MYPRMVSSEPMRLLMRTAKAWGRLSKGEQAAPVHRPHPVQVASLQAAGPDEEKEREKLFLQYS